MIYNLIDNLLNWLEAHGMGFFRVFTYQEFRAVTAIILSFVVVITFGRRTIRWLLKQKVGDNPQFYHKDLNQLMKQKTNTPTMGGILISSAILLTTLLLADLSNFYIRMALVCLLWLSSLGLIDDWLKLTSARRQPGSREGLYIYEKLLFQFGLAVVLGLFIHHFGGYKPATDPDEIQQMSHTLNLPGVKTWKYDSNLKDFVPAVVIVLSAWPFVILTTLVIAGSSNAVNLTDGMDGLASGIMSVVAFAFMILALIAGRAEWAKTLLIPYIPQSDELGIVAGAMVGACLGFLWFNCSRAQVFMGDTGSLPLGGLIGYVAVVIRQEFLLLIIGGIFVIEAVSVLMQIGYFKFTAGKRLFKCAPLHHHFHLAGWSEQQVVVRFWILSAIFAAIALATIKLR